jgi:hypothetical protein
MYTERGFNRTVSQPIRQGSQWTPYVLHSPGEFSLGLVIFSGPPIHRTLLQQTFYGGIWKLKFLLTPSLTLTALKCILSGDCECYTGHCHDKCTWEMAAMTSVPGRWQQWQVYLGDGSNGKCTWEMAAMASAPGRWQQWQVYLGDGSNGKCTWEMTAMTSVPGRWQQWQVYLGDDSNALVVMKDISKTLYWRREAFLWIQDTNLVNCVQLYLLLCTINVLSCFQNG